VKWFRLAALVVMAALAGVMVVQMAATPKAQSVEAAPSPVPTRVPLPTLAPPVVISRTSREALPTPTPEPVPTQPTVYVVDYGYSPPQLTIHAGQSVTWLNQGADGHDVTGSDWRSGPLTPEEAYSRVFAQPGSYPYECTMHPEMRGAIVVEP
jgi:plastocyanin